MRFSSKYLLILCTVISPFAINNLFYPRPAVAEAQEIVAQVGKDEADLLFQQGLEQFQVSQFQEALMSWQAALEVYQSLDDRAGESAALGKLGNANLMLGQYQEAVGLYEQQLVIAREIGDRASEAGALGNLGVVYNSLGQYQQAIDLYEKRLAISREIGDRAGEAGSLENLGIAYTSLGQYQRAIDLLDQVLVIMREIGDRAGEGRVLVNLGNAYNKLGQYQEAIDLYEQQLVITREVGDRAGEGRALGNLGIAYRSVGEYQEAIDIHEQQLVIAREVGDIISEDAGLGSLGIAYSILGQYQRAIELYERQLAITREVGDRAGEGSALGSLGVAYNSLGQYSQAIDLHEQRLAIAREIGDRGGEGIALGNLGYSYLGLGQYQQAINFFDQVIIITREIGDRSGEGTVLGTLGNAYVLLGKNQQAAALYEQQLAITREIGDRAGESQALHNLAASFQTDDNTKLAIAFYKQSVNVSKDISQAIKTQRLQQSFVEQVSGDTYRRLVELLLVEGRLTEGHAVVELLKAQELSEYTNDEQTLAQLSDVVLLPEEEQVLEAYSTRSQANQNIQACQVVDCDELANVTSERDEQAIEYQLAVEALESTNLDQSSGIPGQDANSSDKVQAIIATQLGTVVIYPLVLENKLWLLWATENGFYAQQIEDVSRQSLTQTVTDFRSLVENRYSSIETLQADAEQLYNWLIEPVEESLGEEKALDHLVLSLDGNTRYLPIGALHDGEQYLIEKYDITTILSASLTNAQERSPVGIENVSLLATGASQEFDNFKALPFVPVELDSIVKEQNNTADTVGVYSGQQLLDQAFTLESLQNSLPGKQFLHIATHGEFVSGSRYDSYLLMGDGAKLLISEIAELGSALKGIHLAVLSACQTGLGGTDEEGLEVAGLGYYFFQNEVDAVMASLWNVSDSSTSQLMQRFYQNLSVGTVAEPVTKAEALRQAQLAMLRSNELGTDDNERFVLSPRNGDEARPAVGLAHPYYWAPFTLIGNGL